MCVRAENTTKEIVFRQRNTKKHSCIQTLNTAGEQRLV